MEHSQLPEGETPRWLDDPASRDKVFWFVVASFVVSVLASAAPYERHPYFSFEEMPAFSAVYGLTCCIGLVLAAAQMRTFLMREESYYDDE